MRRRSILLILLPLAACRRRERLVFQFPETMPGGWRLKDTRRTGAKTIGTYEGEGSVTAEVEDTGSFAAALDRTQRTRSEPDMVFFNKGNSFVTVRWQNSDRESLRLFIKKLEQIVQ